MDRSALKRLIAWLDAHHGELPDDDTPIPVPANLLRELRTSGRDWHDTFAASMDMILREQQAALRLNSPTADDETR